MSNRFERFTERARRVLTLAQEEARRLQHDFVGTEHLLLGLLREREGVAGQVLHERGLELNPVRAELEQRIGRGGRVVTGEIGLTPSAKKVVELAVEEARKLGHDFIGTEHILLGVLREDALAIELLQKLELPPEKVRERILKIVNSPALSRTPANPASLLWRKGRKWLIEQKKRLK